MKRVLGRIRKGKRASKRSLAIPQPKPKRVQPGTPPEGTKELRGQ